MVDVEAGVQRLELEGALLAGSELSDRRAAARAGDRVQVDVVRGMLFSACLRRNSTTSPSRTRMNCPGTVPPNVQNVYSTPSASVPFTSVVSRLTITFALPGRSTGGGTVGAAVRIALISGSSAAGPSPALGLLSR